MYYLSEGLKLTKQHKNIEIQTKYDYLIASTLLAQGKLLESLEKFQQSRQMAEANNYNFLPNLLINMSQLQYYLKDYQHSIQTLQHAAQLYIKENDRDGESSAYNNLGIIYKQVQQYDSSFHYHNLSLAISLEDKNSTGIAYSYNNMGLALMNQRKYVEALKYYQKALEAKPEQPSFNLINNMALALTEQNNPKKALELLDKLHTDYAGSGNSIIMRAICGSLHTTSKKLGKYKQALAYFERYDVLNKKILNEEKIKEIERLKIQYEIEHKENEIESLKESNYYEKLVNRQKSVLVVVLSIALGLALLLGALFVRTRIMKARTEQLVLEQRLLRSQMNPHFIFNTLGAIQTYILENENKLAVSYLSKFSRLVRIILENSRNSWVSFDTELQALTHYLELQKNRFQNKFDYSISIDKKIDDTEELYIPPMLFQPFVENTIEHGLQPQKGKGKLHVDFSLDSSFINCIIEDNGIGRQAALKTGQPAKTSLSTSITRERLSLLTKKKNVLHIEDLYENGKVTGTRVKLSIPLLNETT